MIVTRILGNLHEPEGEALVEGRHRETVDLEGGDMVKRIQRLRTDHGREIGLRLPSGSDDLRDGDVLLLEDADDGPGNAVVVRALTTDVIVIEAASIVEMAFVAHSLGNRHLPAQFFDADGPFGAEVMVVQYDRTVEDFLVRHGIAHRREDHQMETPFRHAEHTH